MFFFLATDYLNSQPPQYFLTKWGLVAEPEQGVRYSVHFPD